MKVFAFVVLAFAMVGVLNSAPLEDDNLADEVQKIIDQIVASIPEPMAVKDKVFEFSGNTFEKIRITITEVSLSGLKKLDTKLDFDDKASRLNFTLNYADVAAVVDYTVSLEGLVTVDHHFSAHVNLKNVKSAGYAVVSYDEKKVKELDYLLSLGQATFDLKGLFNNDVLSEQVSKALSDNVSVALNAINPILEPYFSNLLKFVINTALRQ